MITTRQLSILAALSLLAVSSTPAHAEEGWIHDGVLVNIVNTQNGGFDIRLPPDLTACVSQSSYGAHYASVYPSHPAINRMKADMMVALVTGKTVSVWLSEVTARSGKQCWGCIREVPDMPTRLRSIRKRCEAH